MSFEFLAPDQAARTNGSGPALRSPIEWVHLEAGANLAQRDGWNIVGDYGDPEKEAAACSRSVGVADLSQLGKIELQGEASAVASIVSRLAGGVTLELGTAVNHDGVWWCPVTREKVMTLTQPGATPRVRDALEAAGGMARYVTLAPERDEDNRVTRFLAGQGIRVAAGHCNPSLDELRAAIGAGLTLFTHLGNGCPAMMPRHDNIVQRALSLSDQLYIGFIADGVHVPFVALKNYLKCCGCERASRGRASGGSRAR